MEKFIEFMPDGIAGNPETEVAVKTLPERLKEASAGGYEAFEQSCAELRKKWKKASKHGFLLESEAAQLLVDMGYAEDVDVAKEVLSASVIPSVVYEDDPNLMPYSHWSDKQWGIMPTDMDGQAAYWLSKRNFGPGFPG
jgi:hypothetical protein